MSRPSTETREAQQTGESESPVYRRTLLGTAGTAIVAAVAGCTTDVKQQQQQQPDSQPLVDETARVEPGQHEAFPFSIDTDQWVTVDAYLSDRSVDIKQDGPGVDVVIMSPAQQSEFQTDGAFDYIGRVSMPDVVTGQVSNTLESGEYVAIVDNTDVGAAEPDETGVTAVVHLEISATAQRER